MKKLAVFAVIILIAGLVLFTVAFGQADWDIHMLDDEVLTEKSYSKPLSELETPVSKIEVDISSMSVDILREGDSFKVIYFESEYYTYDISTENGVFRVKENSHRTLKNDLFRPFDFARHNKTAKIYVPTQYNEDISFECRNTAIRFYNGEFKTIKLKTTNGMISIENVNAESCVLESTNGVINVNNCNISSIDIDTTNALVSFERSNCLNIKVKTTNGMVNMEHTKGSKVEIKSTNGAVDFYDVAFDEVTANTTNATINVDKGDAKKWHLSTTNGRVNMEFVGARSDYSIETYIGGAAHVTERRESASRSVYAKTTNGRISLDFDS